MKAYITCMSIFCGVFGPAAQASDINVMAAAKWDAGWTANTADMIEVTGSGMMGRDGVSPLVMETLQAWKRPEGAVIQLATGSGMMGGGVGPLLKAHLDREPEMIRELTKTGWGAYVSSGMDISTQLISY
ncbi:hypothetical protein AB9K41_31275 [Cribrihabitans sp. XS_ASV171]